MTTVYPLIIRLGRYYRFRTLNVVRRREQAEEMVKEGSGGGGVIVADTREKLVEGVGVYTNGKGVRYADERVVIKETKKK